MNVLIFGATGMVGQGVLREALLDPGVALVQTIGRTSTGVQHPKLREIVRADLSHFDASDLCNFDASFYCVGVTSSGTSEADYDRITCGLTMAAASPLARLNPNMVFIFVSAVGADSTEKGSIMWARIKGKTENALQRLPFKAVYVFRPAGIQPIHGEQSKTKSYRIGYSVMKPLLTPLRRLFPNYFLTTEEIGRAMLNIAKHGAPKTILLTPDIRAAAQ